MEEQKKAKEIVDKFTSNCHECGGGGMEIEYAIYYVDGIIEVLKNEKEAHYRTLKYWQKVLTEIKQL